jgi:cytochrome c/quinol oxidase subunit I
MEGIGRFFLIASLFYLALGTAMGFTMAFLKGKWTLRLMPAHTHVNLYGWVSQLIFGFAYSYLPIFAGKALYSPTLPYIHLVLGNIGLIGMASMFIGSRFPRSPISPKAVWPFGALVVVSVWIFIFNIAMTLLR